MAETGGEDGAPWRNLYGRRQGKALRPAQRAHLEKTLPRLAIPAAQLQVNPDRAPLDLADMLGGSKPCWLEIGFGSGEHLAHIAQSNPDIGLIGCEPFVNGVAKLVARVDRDGLTNVRVHPGDVRDLLDVLPDGSVARVYLLYPDPWPKRRHHRRRFVNPDQINQLARVMCHGAELRMATDIADYVRHALIVMQARQDFCWTARRPSDWRQPWPDWMSTRYETKAKRAGRPAHYLVWRRQVADVP